MDFMQAIRNNVALESSCAILVRITVDFLGALPRLSYSGDLNL